MKTFAMDVYLLYSYVGVVCAALIAIVLNRVKSTQYKETIDGKFCFVLRFFILFCLLDSAWGLIGSPYLFTSRLAFLISTYCFHIMAAWASFVCSGYVLKTMTLSRPKELLFLFLRISLIIVQMILIFQNISSGNFFTIDADAAYHSHQMRSVAFYLQFCHYIPVLIYAFVMILRIREKHDTGDEIYVYRTALIFSAMPLIFGFLQLLYPDGSFYSLGFLVTAITMYSFNISRQQEKYIAAVNTVQEHERSRAQIEEALARAEAANIAKTVFLSNMSHDIRTPINGIMGMLELAKKEPMSEKVAGYIRKISVASNHLLSLVNDVLDISRIESGKVVITNEPTDIRMIIDNCYSIIQGGLENRDIDFVKKCDELEHTSVFADILHIRQVLINILGNAVKFTPDGGRIVFESREISFDGKKVEVEFRVSDTGIGMSKEFIEHIYEAFSQANIGSRSNYQGTGLGMTITKQFVTLMGGTIDIESEEGKGSTFIVRLPLEYDAEKTVIPEAKNEEANDRDLKGLHIILAEDNELNMEIAQTMLESEGIIVSPAWNGQEAVDLFANHPAGSFDMILMDIMMPVMNGYEASRAIRALPREDAASIPIIAMTANSFAEDKIKAAEAGMNSHVSKPIDFPLLFSQIKMSSKSKMM